MLPQLRHSRACSTTLIICFDSGTNKVLFLRIKCKTARLAERGPNPGSLATRSMRVSIASDEEEMNKHLPFLANVGSVSPYVGLLGTVWGIMTSFQGLSDATQATINAVAPGISEALVATGMGLFAAIPAVIAFNKFTSEAESISQNTMIFAEELASIFYKQSTKK